MWIPTPIYERIPQFWFLLGLLFIATGLYLGFEYSLIFWYGGVGFVCCMYGVAIYFIRLGYRRNRQVVEEPIDPTIEQPIDLTLEQPIDATLEQPVRFVE